MFQAKTFRAIVTSMINTARASQSKITDFSVGAVARTMMESPAVEIEELYLQMLLGLQDAIPVAIYQAFNFPVISALPASGVVTVHFSPALDVAMDFPVGTVLTASAKGLTFYTTASVTAAAGAESVALTVVAAVPGAGGNLGINEISEVGSQLSIPPDTTFTHAAFTSGLDAERDLEQKTRFASFISSISRSTVESLHYGASTATVLDGGGAVQEYVTKVGIDESAGYVNVYLHGSAGIPSATLLANAQALIDGYTDSNGQKIDGYRSAGVEVLVLAMSERNVSIGATVGTIHGALQTAALRSAIVTAIERVILAVGSGSYLYADALVSSVLSIPGVLSCYLTNDTNILCGQFEVILPGTITVTWL